MSQLRKMAALAFTLAALAGCGGDDGTPFTPATATFPLQAAYQTFLSGPNVQNYELSGTCGGWATETTSAPAAGTFEGAPALLKTTTATLHRESCIAEGPALAQRIPPGTDTLSAQSFYDGSFAPLGMSVPNLSYTRFAAPVTIPASVKVGDTAVLGNAPSWTNSAKVTLNGSETVSYAVEADTETSVIVKFITRGFDLDNSLLFTDIESYRLTADGRLTLVRIEDYFPDGQSAILTPR